MTIFSGVAEAEAESEAVPDPDAVDEVVAEAGSLGAAGAGVADVVVEDVSDVPEVEAAPEPELPAAGSLDVGATGAADGVAGAVLEVAADPDPEVSGVAGVPMLSLPVDCENANCETASATAPSRNLFDFIMNLLL
jgi:hypothetical protein